MRVSGSDGQSWPRIRTAGFDGFLISFADQLIEPANRAALAFRAAIDAQHWAGIEESSTSLVSVYLRFDTSWKDHDGLRADLEKMLRERDWYDAVLPIGRKRWRVPTVYGGDTCPQLEEAAQMAGLTTEQAVASISQTPVRVQTIGFAPGMPYLGELPPEWNIPRQTELTDQVPEGGLCVAIRQLVLFPVATPTGWRHIGQTAFRLFRPEDKEPFVLRPGDEILFEPTSQEALDNMQADADGGAVAEVIS